MQNTWYATPKGAENHSNAFSGLVTDPHRSYCSCVKMPRFICLDKGPVFFTCWFLRNAKYKSYGVMETYTRLESLWNHARWGDTVRLSLGKYWKVMYEAVTMKPNLQWKSKNLESQGHGRPTKKRYQHNVEPSLGRDFMHCRCQS